MGKKAEAWGGLAASLRHASKDAARDLYLGALQDPSALRDKKVRDDLLGVAQDPGATLAARQVALDLLRRAPGIDASTIASIEAIAASSTLDDDTRTRAIDLLHQLAATRTGLDAPLRSALLDAADHAPSNAALAFALSSIKTQDASDAEIARVSARLSDPDASVRGSAARALDSSPAVDRDQVGSQLVQALANETDPNAAASLVESTLRVGRAGADALLAAEQAAPLAARDAGLARQIADYRAALASGETDPSRIVADHRSREIALLRSQDGAGN
jgi:hypothetical protein